MLPDIWGQTDYATTTAQALSQRYQQPCYVLDYFYQLTGQANNFNPQADQATASGLMIEKVVCMFVLNLYLLSNFCCINF